MAVIRKYQKLTRIALKYEESWASERRTARKKNEPKSE